MIHSLSPGTSRRQRIFLCASLAALLLAAAAAAPALAQPVELTESAKIVCPGTDTFNEFGWAVALRGDLALVGAPFDEAAGVSPGTASLFRLGPSGWGLVDQFYPDPPAFSQQTGWSVALSPGRAFVGASGYPGSGSLAGRVFTWAGSGGSWTPDGDFAGDDTGQADLFGSSLAVDGDDVLVGAYNRTISIGQEGEAYLLHRSGTSWVQVQAFPPPSPEYQGVFGWDVALDKDTAVITSPGATAGGAAGAGAAYVYVRDGSAWIPEASLVAPDITGADQFGSSVTLRGDILAIGSIWHGGGGAVSVFVRSGGVWSLEDEILGEDEGAYGFFGSDVALLGDFLLVGASTADNVAYDDGVALLYHHEAGEWIAQARLVASDGFNNSNLGQSVALDGTTALVGAPGGRRSAAYVYDLSAFLPSPPTALDLLEELAERIPAMGLRRSEERSLGRKVATAIRLLTDGIAGNDQAALPPLLAFVRLVNAQEGRRLDPADAAELRDGAQAIIAILEAQFPPKLVFGPAEGRLGIPRPR